LRPDATIVDMTLRVGINGFGRTGRAFTRAALARGLDFDIVAINDLGSPESLARLLARDSVHGPCDLEVKATDGRLHVGTHEIDVLAERQPRDLPWARLGVDVVIESTGKFSARDRAAGHLQAGAKVVIVSAPSKGADATFVMGVNDATFDRDVHQVISNASCTTNCLVPMIKVLDDAFGVEQGFMTTVHAYTGDQLLVDGPHKDARRARAAAINIVPTSTGAARATGLVMQTMQGRLDGAAVRVPVADGSLTDLVILLRHDVTADDINAAFRDAAHDGPLVGIIDYSVDDLVSTDIIGSSASCVFDSQLTMASGRLAKVFGWYDNEWGYANRLAELTELVGLQG
jgi:glyceraldehyde 3-phosphate dehydrogenase